jgi:hypothetical protein
VFQLRALEDGREEGEHLGDDAALELTVGLVALWRDGIDLVDEDDGGGVLLGLPGGLRRLDSLELHGVHRGPDQEEVALLHRAVGLQEVQLEVHVEEVPGHALDGVVQGEDVDALPAFDIAAVHRLRKFLRTEALQERPYIYVVI